MILRRLHMIATSVIALLGVAHVALTPVFHPGLGEAAMWFAGSGLALLLAALLNVQALRAPRTASTTAIAGNVAATAFFALLVVVVPEPQVAVALAAFITATVTSILAARRG